MTSQFFLSLTAFSLALSISTYAEEALADDEFVELVFEEEVADALVDDQQTEPVQKGRRVAPENEASQSENASVAEQKEPLQKRMKPHFAGVRRTAESKPKTSDPQKKPRKIKNQWFSSKTQPKNDKREAAEVESDSAELPPDRPYFNKVNYSISPAAVAQTGSSGNASMQASAQSSEAEGEEYPRTGFQAPNGHVYLTGEWLYWRTRQQGMEFATSKQIEFDFQSGFRVGLGAHLPSFDGWCIYANYTNFFPEHSHSTHGSPYPLFLFQGSLAPANQGNSVAEAHGHWKIGFQSVDVEFGKAYYLTKTLVFSPFFGFKGAWIDQHAKFRYEGGFIPAGQTFRTEFKNDFKGAGPLLGTEINWQLGAGFSLFGDIAAALIAGHFDNGQKQFQLDEGEVVHLDTDFNLVSPMVQMVAGAAWDRNFHRDRCHFGLSAGFESQYWWSQNQTEVFTDDVHPIYVRQNGDLSFYGLTLRARFDF